MQESIFWGQNPGFGAKVKVVVQSHGFGVKRMVFGAKVKDAVQKSKVLVSKSCFSVQTLRFLYNSQGFGVNIVIFAPKD